MENNLTVERATLESSFDEICLYKINVTVQVLVDIFVIEKVFRSFGDPLHSDIKFKILLLCKLRWHHVPRTQASWRAWKPENRKKVL